MTKRQTKGLVYIAMAVSWLVWLANFLFQTAREQGLL
jgi:preprotein translocase subunit Sec61beta